MTFHAKLGAAALTGLLNIYCTAVPAEPAQPAESLEIAAAQPSESTAERSPAPATPLGELVTTWSGQTRRLHVYLDAPADAEITRAWLFPGEVDSERFASITTSTGLGLREGAGTSARMVLNGGRDAMQPLVFKDVEPGDYSVCGQVSPEGASMRDFDWRQAPSRCMQVTLTRDGETILHG